MVFECDGLRCGYKQKEMNEKEEPDEDFWTEGWLDLSEGDNPGFNVATSKL